LAIPTTNTERLAQIEGAIQAIEEGAQEYWIGSRKVKRGDLAAMYAERTRLLNAVNAETYGTTAYASWGT
jgi:hypothetical protein